MRCLRRSRSRSRANLCRRSLALGEVMQAQVRQVRSLPEYADPKRSATLVCRNSAFPRRSPACSPHIRARTAACCGSASGPRSRWCSCRPPSGRRWRRIEPRPAAAERDSRGDGGHRSDDGPAGSAGVDLVVLARLRRGHGPRFWDQAAHAQRAWEEEFIARHAAAVDTRLEVRHGAAGDHVVDVAESEGADLIAMGSVQRLDADERARYGDPCAVRRAVDARARRRPNNRRCRRD